MKESIHGKLEHTRERFEEIAGLLADPDVIGDQNQFRNLSKEYSRLEPIIGLFQKYESISADIASAEEMANDSDDEIREMGQEELASLTATRDALQLVPDTTVEAIERCSGHDGTYAVKKEFHQISKNIAKPVVNKLKRAEADHFVSDCPMAADQIVQDLDDHKANNPMSLLRMAYGI